MRGLVFVVLVAASALAHAQSATNGKALYKLYCQSCHTVDPSTAVEPFNDIMEAAGDPARIAAAAEVDPSQMGWITSTLDRLRARRHRRVSRDVRGEVPERSTWSSSIRSRATTTS